MFKNNKENENTYISTEEVEKMYKFQKKNFEQKIAEQQGKIDDLVDFISARFGEEVLDSDIGLKLKNFEKSLNEIETNYKDNLKRNSKELKKEIEKETQKIAAELNDAQTESYFKLLQKNESDMAKIQKFLDEKEENDERIFNLDKIIKAQIKDSENYRKEMQEGLKTANQKISKISYAGVTSKFDKKIKEECAKLDEKLEVLKDQNKSDISNIDEQFLQKLGQVQEHLQTNGDEIIKLQELFINENEKISTGLESNINRVVVLDERLTEEVENIDADIKKIEEKTNKLNDELTSQRETINDNAETSENAVKSLEEKISKEFITTNESVQNVENITKNLDQRMTKEYETINEIVQNGEKFVNGLEEKLEKEKQEVDVALKNAELATNKLDEKFTKKIEKVTLCSKNNEAGINKLDKKIIKELEKVNEKIQNNKNAVTNLEQKIIEEATASLQNIAQVNDLSEKISNIELNLSNKSSEISNLEEKITEQINTNIASNNEQVKGLEEKLSSEIAGAKEEAQKNKTEINKLDKKIAKEIEKLNDKIQNEKNKKIANIELNIKNNADALNSLEQKLIEEINSKIQSNNTQVDKIKEKLSNELVNVVLDVKNNEIATAEIKEDLTNKIAQTREAVNKLRDIAKNKNAKLEEKINATSESLKNTETQLISKIEDIKKETSDIYANLEVSTNTKIDTKLQEIMEDIGGSKLELSKIETKLLKQNKKDVLAETEKIKTELNEQITNNYNDTKAEFENIAENIEDIRNSMDETIETVGAEVLKLKKEIKQSLENQSNVDIEGLRKEYNKYVTKVNNELAKISKDLLNAQKKNQEQNRNLQVKIKAYIDAKIEKSNNTAVIEQLINDLNLSVLEREKLQKLEMEELLNKKQKAIQKENERMISKKIEEMSAMLTRENKTNTRPRPNKVSLYEEVPTKKKSMYNLIDENQMLKRSAASKNPSLPTKESKSQILKFFYDDED